MGLLNNLVILAILAAIGAFLYFFFTQDLSLSGFIEKQLSDILRGIGGGLTGAAASIFTGKKYGLYTNASKIWNHYF